MIVMSDNSIRNIMDVTMEKLKGMVNADVITGDPIMIGNFTLIPVCRVAYGLATGGSDFPSKSGSGLFGGGGGAGVTITPVAFISVTDGNVKMMPIYNELTTIDKALTMAPELIDKIKELFKKDKKEIAE
jgi:sporulation protein YtfJ